MRVEIKDTGTGWSICAVRSNGRTIREIASHPYAGPQDRTEKFLLARTNATKLRSQPSWKTKQTRT